MKKFISILTVSALLFLCACSPKAPTAAQNTEGLVLVQGGIFKNKNSGYYDADAELTDFYIGKHEVTQKEWVAVMGDNPSEFVGDDLPVEMVSWYDCIEYCNKRSEKEGLEPHYIIDKEHLDPSNKNEFDSLKWTVTVNPEANGYRLPTDSEWEYAAGGGQKSKNFIYSGSDTLQDVGWFWQNAGDEELSGNWSWNLIENNNAKTHPVGTKQPNELGLYDMSGNIREWCWESTEDVNNGNGFVRIWKGGGWIGDASACETSYRGMYEADDSGSDQGFRICRNR